jgi:hypothetical protein
VWSIVVWRGCGYDRYVSGEIIQWVVGDDALNCSDRKGIYMTLKAASGCSLACELERHDTGRRSCITHIYWISIQVIFYLQPCGMQELELFRYSIEPKPGVTVFA